MMNGDATHETLPGEPLPEAFVYLAILVQVRLATGTTI